MSALSTTSKSQFETITLLVGAFWSIPRIHFLTSNTWLIGIFLQPSVISLCLSEIADIYPLMVLGFLGRPRRYSQNCKSAWGPASFGGRSFPLHQSTQAFQRESYTDLVESRRAAKAVFATEGEKPFLSHSCHSVAKLSDSGGTAVGDTECRFPPASE